VFGLGFEDGSEMANHGDLGVFPEAVVRCIVAVSTEFRKGFL
jgi:hypothetical protein